MNQDLPKVIADNCLDFEWSNEKVWQIDAPIETMDISELDWQFEIPFWHIPPRRYVLAPNEVMGDPEKHTREYQKILNADLSHPIDIMKNKRGLWEILDGLHRLIKAYIQGEKVVRVRKIPREKIPEIKKDN